MDFRQKFSQLLSSMLTPDEAAAAVVPEALDGGRFASVREQSLSLRALAAGCEQRARLEKLTASFASRCADTIDAEDLTVDSSAAAKAESDTDTLCEENGSLRDYLVEEDLATATIEQPSPQPMQQQKVLPPAVAASSAAADAAEPDYVPLVEVQRRKQSGRRKKPGPPQPAPRASQKPAAVLGGASGGGGSNPKISVDACFSIYSDLTSPPPVDAAAAAAGSAEPLYEELLRSLVEDDASKPEPPCPAAETAGRRLELAQRVLKEETLHLNILKVLQQYSNALQKRNKPELVQTLFYRLDELQNIQEEFVQTLSARLAEWTDRSSVADLYLSLVQRDVVFEYARHLDSAKRALAKLESSQEFRDMFKTNQKNHGGSEKLFMISVASATTGGMEEISIADAIAMPAKWLVTHSENCKMLIQLSPEGHEDRQSLQKFCDHVRQAFEDLSSGGRRLLKQQMVVEVVGHSQKLRRLFLFSDVLICARQKLASNGEFDLLLKWFIPKAAFVLFDQRRMPADFENKRKELVTGLKAKIKQVQAEITRLKSEAANSSKHGGSDMRNLFKTSASRKLDRCFDQLKKLQGQLIVSVPNLPLKVGRIQEKQYILLLSSELEKREWETLLSDTLLQNCHKLNAPRPPQVSVSEVTELLAAHRYVARGVTDLGYHYLKKSPSPAESEDDMDSEGLIGTLKVVIHKIEGLVQAGSYGVAIELNDLSHHFCRIHATQFVEHSMEPSFEKEFQIQLDGTESSIRFVVTRLEDSKRSVNVGHLDLRLYSSSLKDYYAKCHYLNQSDRASALLLTLSLDFIPSLCSLTREAPPGRPVVFGAPLDQLVDGSGSGPLVPRVVLSLTKSIERHIDELGIYRVSGSSVDLQEVKATIDASPDMAYRALDGVDVHLLTGLLKLFLRELPEPLMTTRLYQPLMQAMDVKDDREKDAKFAELVAQLPEPNRSTLAHLFSHLLRVDQHSSANKMSLANMGIIFGPTLICPATSSLPDSVKVSGLHTIRQGGILVRLLNLYRQNKLPALAVDAAARPAITRM